jgi:hypothetical protein
MVISPSYICFLPGYITTTKLKIILVVEDDVISDLPIAQDEKDSQIKSLLVCHSESCIFDYGCLCVLRYIDFLGHNLTH